MPPQTMPLVSEASNIRPISERPNTDRITRSQHGVCAGYEDNADLVNGIDAGDPLTATGRIKKRLREKDSFDPDDPDRYRYKAYHIRRAYDLFGHIPTIVNDGIKRRAKEANGEDGLHIQSNQDYETFNLILNHLDGLSDDIVRLKRNPKAFRALIRKIREAADQARNNDTANLKKDIACMLTPDGTSVLSLVVRGKKASSKYDRGFDNDVMGKYLCPISLDWDDPHVRQEIREGKHAILACDWPRLLYADCDCDLDDLELGLGRNLGLVRVVKYLFTGRSAAFSETAGGKTTRSGNAALAGMKEITPRVVAYGACMLRYAISNEESWSIIDKEFNLQEFYWHVVSIFDDSDDFGKDLLAWWNMKVFGTSLETASKRTPTATMALSVLRKQREAKRTARRPMENITHRQNVRCARACTPESEDEANETCQTTSASVPQVWATQPLDTDSQVETQTRQTTLHASQDTQDPSIAATTSLAPLSLVRENMRVPSATQTRSTDSDMHSDVHRDHPLLISQHLPYPAMQQTAGRAYSSSSFYNRANATFPIGYAHNLHHSQPSLAVATSGHPQHSAAAGRGDVHEAGPLETNAQDPALVNTQREQSPIRTLAYASHAPPPPPWLQPGAQSRHGSSLDLLAAISLVKPSSHVGTNVEARELLPSPTGIAPSQ